LLKDWGPLGLLFSVVYVVGSVNCAILVLRAKGLGDPRSVHSGNAGATNVARVAGWRVAALVLAIDLGRAAAIEVVAASLVEPPFVPWAGLALVIGNRYPLWHGFRGGKGVAGYLGFVAALCPIGAAIAAVAWVVTHAIGRVPAVASMAMIACLAVAAHHAAPGPIAMAATVVSLLLIIHGHRSNWRSAAIAEAPARSRSEEAP
jgi:acyl phosphate:glycerol-3-phosphate acyltransferase